MKKKTWLDREKMMDKIEKYVKNIKATIFLLINTSKVLFACIVILNSISGVIITTKLYIWKVQFIIPIWMDGKK